MPFSLLAKDDESNKELFKQFIQAQGTSCIVFDSTNIKQFWTDKSVFSRNNLIHILLDNSETKEFKSIPLSIQLSNVLETQDCKVSVITESSDISFSVLNKYNKVLSTAVKSDNFISYNIYSATIHLENTFDFSFSIQFSSKQENIVDIKAIVLSFSPNKESKLLDFQGYDHLVKEFETKGKTVPNSEVQVFVSEESNMIFFKVPDTLAASEKFFYHSYPVDKKDLEPEGEKEGFNSDNFLLRDRNNVFPKPYSSENKFTIVCLPFPAYAFSRIRIGQYKVQRFWQWDYQPKK
jgi:hypothetical protein